MAEPNGPEKAGNPAPGRRPEEVRSDDLDRRRRDLEARLATHRPAGAEEDGKPGSGTAAGLGQALRLSSEFIAGIVVGAGLGWFFDRLLGTSPWGLIVFLFLGFGAGVLNVLRSAGLVADFGAGGRVGRKGQENGK